MNNLQITAKRYKRFFHFLFTIVLIAVPIFWFTIQTRYDIFAFVGISQAFDFYLSHQLSLSTRLLALIVSFIPTGVVLYIIMLLIKLFSQYQQLKVFSSQVVILYKRLGIALIYWFFAQIIYDALISFVLTIHNPHGQRFINISIDRIDILALIVGAIVIVIASVMKKAHRLSQENQLTI